MTIFRKRSSNSRAKGRLFISYRTEKLLIKNFDGSMPSGSVQPLLALGTTAVAGLILVI